MMKHIRNYLRLSNLFSRVISGIATNKERKKLLDWVKKSESHKQLLSRIKSGELLQNRNKIIENIDKEKVWENISSKIQKTKGTGFSYRTLMKYAAIILGLITVPVAIYCLVTLKPETKELATVIEPGGSRGRLILSLGEIVSLDDCDTLITLEENQAVILIDSGKIKYQEKTKILDNLTGMNVLEIPHGGEFFVELAEGTRIWLNSESRLEYPVRFATNTREVYLTGEAYFEVNKNSDKSFIVHTDKLDVKVTGTSFNISAYSDDPLQILTLASGIVKIKTTAFQSDTTTTLIPNQQMVFNTTNQEITVNNVDAKIYTAWTRGFFIMNDEPIERIFQKLERWYDIDVFFLNNEVRQEIFTGKLPRYEDFQIILDLMEKVSDVNFEVSGNTILVQY